MKAGSAPKAKVTVEKLTEAPRPAYKLYEWDSESGGGIDAGVGAEGGPVGLAVLRELADRLKAETGHEYLVAEPDGEVLYHTLAEEVGLAAFGKDWPRFP